MGVLWLLLFFHGSRSQSLSSSILERGCSRVQIWSHRAHLDSSSSQSQNWTCDYVLNELHSHGIRHLDVDVVFHEGQAMVAHPTEMISHEKKQEDTYRMPKSPCSKLSLTSFLTKLANQYGPKEFFLTMEPKAAWNGDGGDFLASPESVVSGIINVLDQNPIPQRNCGIIFQSFQWKEVQRDMPHLIPRMQHHCELSAPLKKSDAPLTLAKYPTNEFRLLMPTIELFGGERDDK